MTAKEKRGVVVDYVKGREGRNQYTQSAKRDQVDSGWSDCSSLQQAAYKVIGISIGSYTGAQIENGNWVTQGGSYPDAGKLLPGDLLFFATNYNNGRPHNVGHVEMYVGGGEISGHGSGIGPTRKDMVAYCKQRNASGKPYIGVKRYIGTDASDKTPAPETVMFVGECTGNDVNVRTGPGTSYNNIAGWPQLDKGNRVDVLEKIGNWYRIKIAGKYIGYIYVQYINEVKEEKKEEKSTGTTLCRTPQWVGQTTTALHVRKWAGKDYDTLKSWPVLAQGTKIDVCDTVKASDGSEWYYIRIAGAIYGFASAKYIKKVK